MHDSGFDMIVTSVNGYGWSREKTKKLGGLSFFAVCSRVAFRIVVILSSCVFFSFFLSWWGVTFCVSACCPVPL
jgi:hypothetical protein